MKLYINGVLDVSANTSGTFTPTIDQVTFGRKSYNDVADYFAGCLTNKISGIIRT